MRTRFCALRRRPGAAVDRPPSRYAILRPMARPASRRPALAVALLTLVGGWWTTFASTPAVAAVTLTVTSPPVRATLVLDATSSSTGTRLTLRGTLRTRSRLQVLATRCFDVRCASVTRRGRVVFRVMPGRRSLDKRVSFRPAVAIRVDIRRDGRRLAGRTLAPRRLRPRPIPGPSGGPAAGNGSPDLNASPAGAPTSFALGSDPALSPAYRPTVVDYTTRCEGSNGIVVQAAVPRGVSIAIDGGSAHSAATVLQRVALTPGQGFRFVIDDASGRHEHVVRCVPADFPSWTVQRSGEPDAAWLAFAPSLGPGSAPYAVIADSFGVPVWWMKPQGAAAIDVKMLPDGTVAWAHYDAPPGSSFSATVYDNVTLSGSLLDPISTVGIGADHHDLDVLPNGNRLLLAYRARQHVDLTAVGGPADATVLDGEVQEVTPTGTLVWSWNSKDHIPPAETTSWGLAGSLVATPDGPAYDLVHLNSVAGDGSGVVISGRHVNAIYRIRRSDSGVDWKLGGTVRAESLDFVDDPLGASSFGGQHDARVLPDSTLTLHDNATGRNRPPRSIRYRIDPIARTATLVDQVIDQRTSVSGCCNSARRLSGGRWIVTNDATRTVTELTPAGVPVLTLTFTAGFTYRAAPLTESEVQRSLLRAGMDSMHPR